MSRVMPVLLCASYDMCQSDILKLYFKVVVCVCVEQTETILTKVVYVVLTIWYEGKFFACPSPVGLKPMYSEFS